MSAMDVRVVRSAKRRKTVEARMVNGTLEILAPAMLSDRQLQPHINRLIRRMERREACEELDDGFLEKRAGELNRRYFGDGLTYRSIRWSHNQEKCFGSCTPSLRTIRISARLMRMPRFVLDYVILHELAHLREPSHDTRFWAYVNRYPKTERARGYLMAIGMEELDTNTPATGGGTEGWHSSE